MRRPIISWPVTALVLLLLCLSRSSAAARLLPLQQPLALHQDNGVTAPAAADGFLIQEDEAVGHGDDLSISESEMMGEGAEPAVACEEGNDDKCLQRRLLLNAQLVSKILMPRLPPRRKTPRPSPP